jgi:hypothetical protein
MLEFPAVALLAAGDQERANVRFEEGRPCRIGRHGGVWPGGLQDGNARQPGDEARYGTREGLHAWPWQRREEGGQTFL